MTQRTEILWWRPEAAALNTDGCAARASTILKQGAESFAAARLRAFPAASGVHPSLTQMIRDQLRRFKRVAAGGIYDKLSGGHLRPIEGAGFVELTELIDIPQLAESPARFSSEPAL